ncbi:uncharacterized protein LOC143294025 [Babylonia areolata]|uniref:uncharacterized protein LOC143294025 n=1 Tax=Babylonia areolata TaxID=304850 RepID=UPI003FD1AA5E
MCVCTATRGGGTWCRSGLAILAALGLLLSVTETQAVDTHADNKCAPCVQITCRPPDPHSANRYCISLNVTQGTSTKLLLTKCPTHHFVHTREWNDLGFSSLLLHLDSTALVINITLSTSLHCPSLPPHTKFICHYFVVTGMGMAKEHNVTANMSQVECHWSPCPPGPDRQAEQDDNVAAGRVEREEGGGGGGDGVALTVVCAVLGFVLALLAVCGVLWIRNRRLQSSAHGLRPGDAALQIPLREQA